MSTAIPATRYFFSTAEALAEGSPGKLFLLYRIVPAREFYVPGNDDTEIRNITTDEDMDENNELAVGDVFFRIEGCTTEGWDKAEVVVDCEVTEENAVNVLKKMGAVECTPGALWLSDTFQFARLIAELEMVGAFDQGGGICSDLMASMDIAYGSIASLVKRAEAVFERAKAATALMPK